MSAKKTTLYVVLFLAAVLGTSCCLIQNNLSVATSALCRATGLNDIQMARQALDDGADVNHVMKFGWHLEFDSDSVLTSAIVHSDARMVSLLIERGADVNLKDGSGHTPLQRAIELDKKDIVKLLETAGAKP